MLIVALTFLPFFIIGFIYFSNELRSVCENNETWLYYILLYAVNKEFLPLRLSTLLAHIKSTVMGTYIGDQNSGIKRKEVESQVAVSFGIEEDADQKFEGREVQQAELNVVISHSPSVVSSNVLNNKSVEQRSLESFAEKQLQKNSAINMQTILLLKNQINKLKKEFTIVSD